MRRGKRVEDLSIDLVKLVLAFEDGEVVKYILTMNSILQASMKTTQIVGGSAVRVGGSSGWKVEARFT